jgi:pyridoxal phosphate enzyme (YggS family)
VNLEHYISIKADISKAKEQALLTSGEVELIAVSKHQPIEKIVSLLDVGHRHFGENRIQELVEKWPNLKQKYPETVLHIIGALQTNKVKDAVKYGDIIHSLDRISLAETLAKEMKKQEKNLPCFVQVNIGDEEQKSGILPHETKAFVEKCCNELGLSVIGLMCLPPADLSPAPYFALLRKLAEKCDLNQLSMGMSNDFEEAIAFGSTHVRIGTALFGARD